MKHIRVKETGLSPLQLREIPRPVSVQRERPVSRSRTPNFINRRLRSPQPKIFESPSIKRKEPIVIEPINFDMLRQKNRNVPIKVSQASTAVSNGSSAFRSVKKSMGSRRQFSGSPEKLDFVPDNIPEQLEDFNAISTPPDEGSPRQTTWNIAQDIEAYLNNTMGGISPSPPKGKKSQKLRGRLPNAVLKKRLRIRDIS